MPRSTKSQFSLRVQVERMSSKPESCQYELNKLLYKLSQQLGKDECNALVVIEELPARLRDAPAFDVLVHLQMQGRFSVSKLEELATILKNVSRDDLAKKVTTHAKNAKKKRKETRCESCTQCRSPYAKLESTLQVTVMQYNILKDQIEQLWKAASGTDHRAAEERIGDLRKTSEQMEKQLKCVSESVTGRHKTLSPSDSISSASSGEAEVSSNPLESEIKAITKQLKSRSLPRNSPAPSGHPAPVQRQPMLPPVSSKQHTGVAVACSEGDVANTESFTVLPTEEQKTSHSKEQPVTETKRKPLPPKTPPKPPKVDSKTTALPTNNITTTPAVDQSVEDNPDDHDYTEVGYTGDSGFSEAIAFIKTDLSQPSPAKPATYMDLSRQTMDPQGCYETPHKERAGVQETAYKVTTVFHSPIFMKQPKT